MLLPSHSSSKLEIISVMTSLSCLCDEYIQLKHERDKMEVKLKEINSIIEEAEYLWSLLLLLQAGSFNIDKEHIQRSAVILKNSPPSAYQ